MFCEADLSPLEQSGCQVIVDGVGAASVARVLQLRDGAGTPVDSSQRGWMEREGLPRLGHPASDVGAGVWCLALLMMLL